MKKAMIKPYLTIIILIILCACGGSTNDQGAHRSTMLDKTYVDKLYSELKQLKASNDSIINLSQVFDFSWDQLIIPKAYTDIKSLKKDYSGINKQIERIKYDDSQSLLLFAKEKEVVKYVYLSNIKSNFSSAQNEDIRFLMRDETQFKMEVQITNKGDSLTRLVYYPN